MKIFCAGLLAAFILTAQPPAARAGVVLITPEEAQLPTPKGVHAARAVTRGPRIDLAGPDASEVRSPLSLQLKFRGFGGATINLVAYHEAQNFVTHMAQGYERAKGMKLTPLVCQVVDGAA